jgi:hypothetical protein
MHCGKLTGLTGVWRGRTGVFSGPESVASPVIPPHLHGQQTITCHISLYKYNRHVGSRQFSAISQERWDVIPQLGVSHISCSLQTANRCQSEMSVDSDYTPEFSLGMRPEMKQLYRPDDRAVWNEMVPDNTRANVEAGSYAQECALIVRREPHPGKNNQVAMHSITIQSPLIKKVLEGTFEGFEGLNTRLKQLTFKAPFHPFYYRWHRFEKLHHDEQDQVTKKHLDLLHSILSKEVLPHIEAMEDFTKNKVISFEYLWAIFSPGMEVYTQIDGQDRIVSLRDSRYGANMSGEFFSLECRYIDGDGSGFGYVSTSFDLASFDGVKKLVDLDAIPSHLHPDVESLLGRLHARGQKLEQLNGFHHMSYSGFYTARSSRQIRKRHVRDGLYPPGHTQLTTCFYIGGQQPHHHRPSYFQRLRYAWASS